MLLRTDWSKKSGRDYVNMREDGQHTPGPCPEVVRFLVEERDLHGFGTETIGTDAGQAFHFNPPYPAHYYMHGKGRYGLQCLTNLDLLPPTGSVIVAAPLKIRRGSGSPLRVLALVPRGERRRERGDRHRHRCQRRHRCGHRQGDARARLSRRLARPRQARLVASAPGSRRGRSLRRQGDGEVAAEIAGEHDVTHIVHNAGVIRPNAVDRDGGGHRGAGPASSRRAVDPARRVAAKDEAAAFGRVVLISSRAALGAIGRTAYSATKAGIIGMGRTWALELAPFGITVNMVAPGPIQGTQMFHEIVPAGSDRETALAAAIPMRRLGQPEDVANAVLFFAGREASFVTGQVLYVCGGASVGTLVI